MFYMNNIDYSGAMIEAGISHSFTNSDERLVIEMGMLKKKKKKDSGYSLKIDQYCLLMD